MDCENYLFKDYRLKCGMEIKIFDLMSSGRSSVMLMSPRDLAICKGNLHFSAYAAKTRFQEGIRNFQSRFAPLAD
jgi:hypothetical protein